MEPTTVIIVDDHKSFRKGLISLLESVPDINVIAEAPSGQEAILLAARLQPDVILMDLQMPGVTGIEATRQILHTSPHIAILVITMFEDDDSVFSALRAGARGYLLKGALKAEILRAIRGICNGEAIFGPAIARRVLHYFSSRPNFEAAPVDAFPELTDRERELLNLMASQLSNQEIAVHLDISLKTVRNHVSNIFSKLQVVDRSQAIFRARQAGLGHSKSP
jgi:DNA-binding NarL/FixJ family response regulator